MWINALAYMAFACIVVLVAYVAFEFIRQTIRRHHEVVAPATVHETAEVLSLWQSYTTDERRLVLLIMRRLAMGQRQYGPLRLAKDRRDWRHEASEELLDGTIYLAAECLRVGDVEAMAEPVHHADSLNGVAT